MSIKNCRFSPFFLFLLFACAFPFEIGFSEEGERLGPCDLLLDHSGDYLYVLEEDAGQLRRVRTDGSAPAEILPLPVRPRQMAFFPDETHIAVAGSEIDITDSQNPDGSPRDGSPWESVGRLRGKVILVQMGNPSEPMTIDGIIDAGHSPSDIAVAPMKEKGATTLYVSDQFAETVTEIAWPSKKTLRKIDAGREPFALKITPDGKFLVVAGLLPEERGDIFHTMSCVRVIDTQTGEVHKIELSNGVSNLKDIALSPDGKYAFVTGTIGNYQTVPIQVVGGWIVENLFTIIDVPNHQIIETIYLDDAIHGAANPWGIDVAEDGSFLVLTVSGTDEVIFMPYNQILKMITERPSPNLPGHGSYTYFSRKKGDVQLPIRIRVPLGIPGMRHILIRNNTVWVTGLFEDAIGRMRISLNPPYEFYSEDAPVFLKAPRPLNPDEDVTELPPNPPLHFVELEPYAPLKGVEIKREIARLGSKPVLTPARRGEILFHSALYCMEHWQSCITCHPEARVDGLNWDLTNDGIGNPKSSKSLLLSHETPPSMITGVRADAETAVRAGVVHILFSKLPEEDYVALDEYLKSLRPIPSPRLVNGRLSDAAKRGKILFESERTNCSSCHPAPLFTDLSRHKTGSGGLGETFNQFDTPTLIELWRTAPYMNNGHYLTVREVLTEGKHGNKEGLLDRLTDQELDDLIEYVLSL